MLVRSRYTVQLKRHSLGILQCWEGRRPWTPKEEALLGTRRDAELGKRLNRNILSVRTQRLMKTKVRFIKTPRRWTAAELRMLGRLSDSEVARRTGRFLAPARNKRLQLGIPRAPK